MQMIQASLQPRFPMGAPARYRSKSGADARGFSQYADRISSEAKSYADIPIEDIKTRKVKVKTVDHEGNIKEEIKEMAVCPECGETNCPCIARITVQARLDEENAKGVRNSKKPEPLSIVPQTFNQMSINFDRKAAPTAQRRYAF